MKNAKVPPKVCEELKNAVYDDWKRQAVDSAKKRAVGQASDYEAFKNMVSVAHLRPIGAETRSNGILMTPAMCIGRDGQLIRQNEMYDTLPGEDMSGLALNGADFRRIWRRKRATKEEKLEYLKRYTPNHLRDFFKVELDGLLLNDIIDVLLYHVDKQIACPLKAGVDVAEKLVIQDSSLPQDAVLVLTYLDAIRHSGQFKTACQLLPRSTIARLTAFFHSVVLYGKSTLDNESQAAGMKGAHDNIESIANLFRVSLSCNL
eukprot:jgi/Ulvmu1/7590/UM038_0013.1